jgi:hypothetical protein
MQGKEANASSCYATDCVMMHKKEREPTPLQHGSLWLRMHTKERESISQPSYNMALCSLWLRTQWSLDERRRWGARTITSLIFPWPLMEEDVSSMQGRTQHIRSGGIVRHSSYLFSRKLGPLICSIARDLVRKVLPLIFLVGSAPLPP